MPSPFSTPSGRESIVAALARHSLTLAVVACLLALAAANISLRASWHEVEDGVLWAARPEGVVAAEVAPRERGAEGGLRPGDLLLAIDGPPSRRPDQVLEALHGAQRGQQTLLHDSAGRRAAAARNWRSSRFRRATARSTSSSRRSRSSRCSSGCLVRLRRPNDPATLHFFWLCVAFFGVFAFSFSGRLDRLDWVFYWADVVAVPRCRRCSCTSRWCSPIGRMRSCARHGDECCCRRCMRLP